MHGVARLRTTEEEKARKKKEREAELAIYKSQVAEIFDKRSKKEYDMDVLKLIGELLSRNPDFSTVWNYRREVILHLLDKDVNNEEKIDFKELFDNDLKLTETCLRYNPKSYCAWHHRLWVLQTRKDPNWEIELKLCTAFLKLDERNFHCWNYRDHVVKNFNVDLNDEFEYTMTKIQENFSNYSAWHYRSKLLMKLCTREDDSDLLIDNKQRDELDLVINAAFTDPNDTSAWFYQRWLLGVSKKEVELATCYVNSKETCVSFNQNVKLNLSNCIIRIDDVIIEGVWEPVIHKQYDVIWILKHDQEIKYDSNSKITINFIRDDDTKSMIICDYKTVDEFEPYFVGCGKISFSNNFGPSVIKALNEQLIVTEQLLELEPDSKWTLLTYAVLKHSLDHISNYDSCRDILIQLQTLDWKRANYYKDLMSRWHIEYLLETDIALVLNGKFVTKDQENVELTNLYHGQYWSACYKVDLSNFKMSDNFFGRMKAKMLHNCKFAKITKDCDIVTKLKNMSIEVEIA